MWLTLLSAIVSSLAAVIAVGVAAYAVCQTRMLQKEQWRKDELERRRDVLRRLVGYSYRLTSSFTGTDGEPFIALNEAWVVFADVEEVTLNLKRMHNELGHPNLLRPNILALVKSMAIAAEIPLYELDDKFIESPFTPPNNDHSG
ncbi:MAG: hypothetical protein OXE17_07025 [Chloroflexi bacterium]|nr:hypothetical protein [Chloroflexota bacterium]